MLIRIGLENSPTSRTLAWALDFPGCFSYGADEGEALLTLPSSLLQHDYWIRLHTEKPWFHLNDLDLHVDETFLKYAIPYGEHSYTVNAFFKDDRRPLSEQELAQATQILTWQHEELLAGLEFANPKLLDQIKEGQRWGILGILEHVANAEIWYLQNIGINALALPENLSALEKIEASYQKIMLELPTLADSNQITSFLEEQWTPRKFLRRLLWHRRDHIDHIKQLLGVPTC